MLSDLDRTFDPQKPYVYPVAYGYSSKTLKVETVRNMLDYLRRELMSYDINVQVEAFDGQFIKLAIDGKDGSSLTLLQERKKHWKEVCKITVNDLARPYLEVGKLPCVHCYEEICTDMAINLFREALTVKLQSQELESARTNDIDTDSEQHDIELDHDNNLPTADLYLLCDKDYSEILKFLQKMLASGDRQPGS
ncbi:unnamed protein product [Mytilus edulis]|uniref:Uncharacterized protein n=1 Tax=Mytilus edulis TaxID=6550 RepID=A0A8S3R9N2_MYTED|nr:unnamed protein product [Mytilus edulis]